MAFSATGKAGLLFSISPMGSSYDCSPDRDLGHGAISYTGAQWSTGHSHCAGNVFVLPRFSDSASGSGFGRSVACFLSHVRNLEGTERADGWTRTRTRHFQIPARDPISYTVFCG